MSLVEFPGGIWTIGPSRIEAVWDGYTLDTATKRIVMVVRIPRDGTLDGVEFKPGSDLAINAASEIRVSFQDIGANDPDGTQDEYRDLLGNSLSTSLWKDTGIMSSDGTDNGTKRAVLAGDTVAIVFEYETFTASDVFSVRSLKPTISNNDTGVVLHGMPYWQEYNGSNWLGSDFITSLALRYVGGTYAFLGPTAYPADSIDALLLQDTGQANDEMGLSFSINVDARIRGIYAIMGVDRSIQTWEFRVYNSADTLIGVSSVHNANLHSASQVLSNVYLPLLADADLVAGERYRATIRALSSESWVKLHRALLDKPEHLDAFIGGRSFYSTRRSNGGVWTDETSIFPFIGLHFSHFADVSGGGGGGGGSSMGRGFNRGGIS